MLSHESEQLLEILVIRAPGVESATAEAPVERLPVQVEQGRGHRSERRPWDYDSTPGSDEPKSVVEDLDSTWLSKQQPRPSSDDSTDPGEAEQPAADAGACEDVPDQHDRYEHEERVGEDGHAPHPSTEGEGPTIHVIRGSALGHSARVRPPPSIRSD